MCAQQSYFARDATYSIYGGFGQNCKTQADGRHWKLLLLNMVEVGVPTLGEGHLDINSMPYISESEGMRHTATTDSVANPEMFCLPQNHFAYPAYVIWFPANIGP